MKRILVCFVCAVLVSGLAAGKCFADPEESYRKLIENTRKMKEADQLTAALTEKEENEFIDYFINKQKKEGRTFTRQQAAILIGQLAGYVAIGEDVKQAFRAI